MKRFSLLVAVVLVASIGCSAKDKKTEVTGEGDKKLTLTAPGNATVKQGESEKITVKITKEKFDDDVDLKFSQLPEGVTVEESTTKIAKGSTESIFHLKADAKAPLKENQVVKVTASGPGKMETTSEFKVSVKDKK